MYYAGDAIYRMINFRKIGSRAVRLNDDSFSSLLFSSSRFHHLFHPLTPQSSEIKYKGRIAVYGDISFSSSLISFSSPFFLFLFRHKRVPLLFLSFALAIFSLSLSATADFSLHLDKYLPLVSESY